MNPIGEIPQQDDIFGAYDRKYSIAVDKDKHLEPSNVYEFPKYVKPIPPVAPPLNEIDFPGAQVVGSTTFNVNDLIAQGLFDAAEYFLGRRLTAAERNQGLGRKSEVEHANKLDQEQTIVDALVKIVKKIEAKEPDDEEDKKEDAKKDDAKKDDDKKDDAKKDDEDPSRELQFDDLDLDDTFEEPDESKYDTVEDFAAAAPVNNALDALNGKKYQTNNYYTVAQARAIIDEWRAKHANLATSFADPKNESVLFGKVPRQKNKETYNKWLRDSKAEMDRLTTIPDAPPMTPDAAAPALKRGLDLSEIRKGTLLKKTPTVEKPESNLGAITRSKSTLKSAKDRQLKEAKSGPLAKVLDEIKQGKLLSPVGNRKVPKKKIETTPLQDLANAALANRRVALAEDEDWEEPGTPPQTVIRKIQGKGLPPGRKPAEWTPFGRYLIAADKLRDEDLVSIVSVNRRMKLNRLPNKTVSAGLKVCLLEQIAGRPMPTDILNDEEKTWLDWLLHECGIKSFKKPIDPPVIKRTPKMLKERLAVLYGEIAGGPNDNPALVAELKALFGQAMLRGILSDAQIINMKEFIQTLQ